MIQQQPLRPGWSRTSIGFQFDLAPDFWFGQVNSRPLSLFRVGIALVILRDALLHLPIAAAFYSDSGLTPRAAVWSLLGDQPMRLSVLDGVSQPWLATLFFLLWAGVALCLLLGYKTRLAAALNFICVLSVYWRNPFITSGADDILRVVSFWMLFIPINHHFALDNRHTSSPPTTAAFPVRLLQLQLALIYLGAGLSKLLGGQWTDGTALFYVLQLDSLLRPLGHWFSYHIPLWGLQGLTYGILLLEISFPILVFTPIKQPMLRHLALVLMGLMHLSIALVMTMPLWDFLLVLGASYLLFAAQSASKTDSPNHNKSMPQRGLMLILAGLMGLVFWQNGDGFRVFGVPLVPKLPAAAANLLDLTGLRQNWSLFAPQPYQSDWMIIVPGTLADGTRIDLRTGDPIQETIRPLPSGTPYRWKRFEQVLALQRPPQFLKAWADSYCHQYTGHLEQLQIHVLYRNSHAPGVPPHAIKNEIIWLHLCD